MLLSPLPFGSWFDPPRGKVGDPRVSRSSARVLHEVGGGRVAEDTALAPLAAAKALAEVGQQAGELGGERLLDELDRLLDRKFPPGERRGHYRPGDENEALLYLGGFLAGWKAT